MTSLYTRRAADGLTFLSYLITIVPSLDSEEGYAKSAEQDPELERRGQLRGHHHQRRQGRRGPQVQAGGGHQEGSGRLLPQGHLHQVSFSERFAEFLSFVRLNTVHMLV